MNTDSLFYISYHADRVTKRHAVGHIMAHIDEPVNRMSCVNYV